MGIKSIINQFRVIRNPFSVDGRHSSHTNLTKLYNLDGIQFQSGCRLVKQISDHFAYSGNTSYANFLWLSQSMHGLCMKSETEHYRRLKGDPDVQTMG
jgi:hypothetical protein